MTEDVAPDPVVVGLKRALAFLIGGPAILLGAILLTGLLMLVVQVLAATGLPPALRLVTLGMLGMSLWGPFTLLFGGYHLLEGTSGGLAVTLIGWVLTFAAFVAWFLGLAGLVTAIG